MNCQDISRILDSGDMHTLSPGDRQACEAHATTCTHCGPDWIVYTRLAAIPAPPMPQNLTVQCEALAAAQLGADSVRRPPSRVVLLGTVLAVAAAAALLVASLTVPTPLATIQGSNAEAIVPGIATIAGPELDAPQKLLVPSESVVRPDAVQLVLDQATDDAIGRDLGQQVFERAREELRTLSGLVLVDAGIAGDTGPAYRITYTNRAKSGLGSSARTDGLAGGLLVLVEMEFKVEAFQMGAEGEGMYHTVFSSGASPPAASSVRTDMVSVTPGAALYLPAECIRRRESHCPYTPADIAAYTILSWHLKTKPPGPQLVERLMEMVADSSSPPGIWMMAFRSLSKYEKLRADASGLLATGELNGDPELRASVTSALIRGGNGPDLMRLVQDRLSRELPNTDRAGGFATRSGLVKLLATDLRDEPGALAMLESVAATDPNSEVRAEAQRVLRVGPQ